MSAARHQKDTPCFQYKCSMNRSESYGRPRRSMIWGIFLHSEPFTKKITSNYIILSLKCICTELSWHFITQFLWKTGTTILKFFLFFKQSTWPSILLKLSQKLWYLKIIQLELLSFITCYTHERVHVVSFILSNIFQNFRHQKLFSCKTILILMITWY